MAHAGEPATSLVVVPLAAGVLVGGAVVTGAGMGAWLGTCAAAIALATTAAVAPPRVRVVLVALLAGGVLGGARAALERMPLPADHVAHRAGRVPVAVEGTIVASGRVSGAERLVVRASTYRSATGHGAARGLVAVTVAHPTRAWPAGVRVRFVARLRRPRNFGNPGGYDMRRALARRGVFVTAFLWDDRTLALASGDDDGLMARLDRALGSARGAIGAAVDAASAEPARGFLRAVLIGEDGALAADTRRALARTGLSHVVSVSGFHLAVVAAAAVVVGRRLLLRSERLTLAWNVAKLAALAGAVPVGVYAALAGGSIPASRSLLMYGTFVVALLADRRTDGVRSLAAAALVLALLVPDVAADISFELSFVSVAALVLVAVPPARRSSPAARTWWRTVLGVVAASLRVACAAAAATVPLTAWHFQQVSLIAPIANLVALPLLGPATLLPGLAALPLVAFIPSLAVALLRLAALAADVGLRLATALAAVPAAACETPMPNGAEVALAYAVLAAPLVWPRMRRPFRRVMVAGLLALVAVDVAYWTWERAWSPRLRVTFLSVGQGDAAVIELPRGGGAVVVDGGGLPGAFDTGERIVAPFLRSRKIRRLEALALSHPQLDHYGGLAYLAEHFAPRAFWSNGTRADALGFARLERALAAAGTRRIVLRRGMRALAAAGATIDVLHPTAPEREDPNNGSLVLGVAYGGASVLLTGDVEAPAEGELLQGADARIPAGLAPPGAAVVLKVAHHGSATSTSAPFVAAVRPTIAVISDGADNRFGFPAPAVLRRLRAARAEIWRTDLDGAVQLASDGRYLVVGAPCATRPPRVVALSRAVADLRFEFPTSVW